MSIYVIMCIGFVFYIKYDRLIETYQFEAQVAYSEYLSNPDVSHDLSSVLLLHQN